MSSGIFFLVLCAYGNKSIDEFELFFNFWDILNKYLSSNSIIFSKITPFLFFHCKMFRKNGNKKWRRRVHWNSLKCSRVSYWPGLKKVAAALFRCQIILTRSGNTLCNSDMLHLQSGHLFFAVATTPFSMCDKSLSSDLHTLWRRTQIQ